MSKPPDFMNTVEYSAVFLCFLMNGVHLKVCRLFPLYSILVLFFDEPV